MSPSSKADPRDNNRREPVYRWNTSDGRWQVWNGRRWTRSTLYATRGEHDKPRLTMTYEETYFDLQEIA